MATKTITGRWMRRVVASTRGDPTRKGESLALASNLWFALFLLAPLLIIFFFGLTTVNADLTISYTQLTGAWYFAALNPFGSVLPLAFKTVAVAIASVAGALAIGVPIAYYLARICPEKHRGILVSLFVIPFWISFVVQVYAILPWVDPNGYIGDVLSFLHLGAVRDWLFANFGLGSSYIVVPALTYIWLPFMILPVYTAFLRIDPVLLEAAQNLGAGKWKTFTQVTLPLAYNGVLTGTILVFISAFGSFVEPKILAGKNGLLIGNYIEQAFLEFGYLPRGAAAAVVVLVPTIILLYLYVAYAQTEPGKQRRASRLQTLLRKAWAPVANASRRLLPAPRPTEAHPDGRTTQAPVVRGRLEQWFDRISTRRGALILAVFTALVLLASYLPLAQVVVFSFNHDNNIINWSYASLRWYLPAPGYQEVRALFGDQEMLNAMFYSFAIGGTVTAFSLILGIPAAMAIVRYRFGSRPFLNMMLYTGLVIPSIILGVSLLVFIRFANDAYLWPYLAGNWDFGFWSIVVGHVTFCIPIVIVVLLVSLREFDRSIEEAAMNLGADELRTFFSVTLPNIMPGIVSAALLSFTFSFSEVVVTLFLKGGSVETLPVVFWATLSKHIPTPELNAASTLILGLSILFVFLANKVQRGGTLYRF